MKIVNADDIFKPNSLKKLRLNTSACIVVLLLKIYLNRRDAERPLPEFYRPARNRYPAARFKLVFVRVDERGGPYFFIKFK